MNLSLVNIITLTFVIAEIFKEQGRCFNMSFKPIKVPCEYLRLISKASTDPYKMTNASN